MSTVRNKYKETSITDRQIANSIKKLRSELWELKLKERKTIAQYSLYSIRIFMLVTILGGVYFLAKSIINFFSQEGTFNIRSFATGLGILLLISLGKVIHSWINSTSYKDSKYL